MASKRYVISATTPAGLNLTPGEATELKKAFRTCVVDVFSASRQGDPAPFPEVNISRPRRPKAAAKKSSSGKGKKR